MYHSNLKKIPGQLVFGQDMILSINNVAYGRYISQHKQPQINKDIIRENTTIIDHDYREGDTVTTTNMSAYKYKTPFKGPYEIVQTWTNGIVTLRMGAVTTRINIRHIKPYNDTYVE